jgi:hypothetical protein
VFIYRDKRQAHFKNCKMQEGQKWKYYRAIKIITADGIGNIVSLYLNRRLKLILIKFIQSP